MGACASSNEEQVKQTPESEAHFALGVSAYGNQQYPAALAYFNQAESKAPSNPSYQMHTGLALMALERFSDAEKKLQTACSTVSEYPDCWNNLAAFYLRVGKPSESLTYSRRAAASPSYATPETALANEARALIALKKYNESLEALQKAERIGQSNCGISLLKAQTLSRLKYYDLALQSARKGESQCSSDSKTHFWVAYLHQKIGRPALAAQKYKSILETFRDEKTVFQTNQYLEQLEKRIPLKEPQL